MVASLAEGFDDVDDVVTPAIGGCPLGGLVVAVAGVVAVVAGRVVVGRDVVNGAVSRHFVPRGVMSRHAITVWKPRVASPTGTSTTNVPSRPTFTDATSPPTAMASRWMPTIPLWKSAPVTVITSRGDTSRGFASIDGGGGCGGPPAVFRIIPRGNYAGRHD